MYSHQLWSHREARRTCLKCLAEVTAWQLSDNNLQQSGATEESPEGIGIRKRRRKKRITEYGLTLKGRIGGLQGHNSWNAARWPEHSILRWEKGAYVKSTLCACVLQWIPFFMVSILAMDSKMKWSLQVIANNMLWIIHSLKKYGYNKIWASIVELVSLISEAIPYMLTEHTKLITISPLHFGI